MLILWSLAKLTLSENVPYLKPSYFVQSVFLFHVTGITLKQARAELCQVKLS